MRQDGKFSGLAGTPSPRCAGRGADTASAQASPTRNGFSLLSPEYGRRTVADEPLMPQKPRLTMVALTLLRTSLSNLSPADGP